MDTRVKPAYDEGKGGLRLPQDVRAERRATRALYSAKALRYLARR